MRSSASTAWMLFGFLVVHAFSVAPVAAESQPDCPCLENGGQPGPGDCPCDVEQCFNRCVDTLCPDMPNCMLECSLRCFCNDVPPGCLTHVDPGATPTPIPSAPCFGDRNGDDRVTIDELVGAVSNALSGCPH